MSRLLFPLAVLAPSLLAQDGPPTFVPKHGLAMIRVEDIPKLLEQLPHSTIGKLLDDKEVGAAFAAGLARFRARAQRRAELMNALRTTEIELHPWAANELASVSARATLRELDLADMQRFEFGDVLLDGDNVPRFASQTFYANLSCRPRAEGRWTAIFERLAKDFGTSKQWTSEPNAKFAGFPAFQFRFAAKSGENQQQMLEYYGEQRTWLLHLPGVFAFGGASPEQCGTFAPAPARPPAELVGEMNLAAFGEMFQRVGGRVPMEYTALGFDGLKLLRWRLRFLGADVLDEIEVELGDEPKGLVGALLVGKAALPAQPLPAGALAQIRGGFDLDKFVSCLPNLGAPELPPELVTLATKALTGGIALGACAPAQGAMIPRIYLSLGIADAKLLDELLAKLFPGDTAKKQVTYEEVPCTVLTVPGMPAAFQPTWCVIDGVLHVAESAASMRAFLKARAAGGAAMDVGALPEPPGEGEVLPTLDVRCDQQELYRTFHKVWLPLVKLIPFGDEAAPLLTADDMPSPEAVLPLLGKSRGVLRRQGKVYRLQQLGPLGGLAAAGLAMTWGPIVSGPFHNDYTSDNISAQLARKKLDAVWASLEAFEKEHKRRPNDLGELFASDKKLAPDALLLPGDDKAEPVPLPAGDARTIKSSFRYFKDGVKVDVNGNQQKMLLIAIGTARYNRPMLGDDGSTPESWGEENHQPIDQFGK
jgi:hypothetical protein